MTQGVAGDTLKPRVLKRRHIDPTIEVVWVQMRIGVLTREYPHRRIARDKAPQNLLRLVHQVHILDGPGLGMGKRNQSKCLLL